MEYAPHRPYAYDSAKTMAKHKPRKINSNIWTINRIDRGLFVCHATDRMINNVGALDDWERGSLSAYIVSHRRRCYYVSAGINSRHRQRLKYNINCRLRCSRSNRLPYLNRHNIRCVDLEYCRAMLKAFCKRKITFYHPITHSSHFCLVCRFFFLPYLWFSWHWERIIAENSIYMLNGDETAGFAQKNKKCVAFKMS